jgi:hypothetical protein
MMILPWLERFGLKIRMSEDVQLLLDKYFDVAFAALGVKRLRELILLLARL